MSAIRVDVTKYTPDNTVYRVFWDDELVVKFIKSNPYQIHGIIMGDNYRASLKIFEETKITTIIQRFLSKYIRWIYSQKCVMGRHPTIDTVFKIVESIKASVEAPLYPIY